MHNSVFTLEKNNANLSQYFSKMNALEQVSGTCISLHNRKAKFFMSRDLKKKKKLDNPILELSVK